MTIAQLADKFFASGEWDVPELTRSTCTRCGRSLTPLVFANHNCGDAVRDYVLVIPVAWHEGAVRDPRREKLIARRFIAA